MKIQQLLKKGLISGLIATVINIIVYFITWFTGLISNDALLPDGKPLGLIPVIVSTFLSAIIASVFLFGLSKLLKNSMKVFLIIGVSFLAISMLGPIGTPNLTVGMRITLSIMHLVAGFTIIYILRKTDNETKI